MSKIVRKYHQNGKLKSEVFEINGKINGEYKRYHANGQLEIICSENCLI